MTSITETILFIKNRMEGLDLDPVIEKVIQKKEQNLEMRMNLLRGRLLEKQKKFNDIEKELLNDVIAVDIFEAAKYQKDNIQETLEALKPVVSEMEDKLATSEKGLAAMQIQTTLLTNEFNKLATELRRGKGKYYAFSGPLEQLSQKVADKKQGKI